MSCDSFLAGESDPVWADGRPLLTVEVSGFGVAQTPTVDKTQKSLLLQFTLLCCTGLAAHGAHLARSEIIHFALRTRGIATLDCFGCPLVGGRRAILKETYRVSPPPR